MNWLFDANSFVTRNQCGAWSPQLILVYQIANMMVFLAYFSIPIILIGLWFRFRSKLDIFKYPWILLFFAVFIFSCGMGHLCNIIVFWWPAYRLFTFIDILTATSSIITAILLPKVVKEMLEC